MFLIIGAVSIANDAYTYNKIPSGLPEGLPSKIQGKYRIIEHGINGAENDWVVYDTNSYAKDIDGVVMKAPVYYYDNYNTKKWHKKILHENYHTQYMPELITIIDAKAKLSSKNTVYKALTSQEAISKINTALKNKIWFIKSVSYKSTKEKTGLLLCGLNTKVSSDTIRAIWYSTNGEVFNVNGIAKGNTPNFNFTFDIQIDSALKQCQSLNK